ncbi:GH3 auxin-responsive promoter family protein [Clostridium swellfunianum]|uniref:GH3 auxin-responsive promoter family protein n=1 Tax=Clostridium swellfunianum TaxID=1367462 RepID=UPI00202FA8F5|nr:GH3 auxin-responsive promoter family protein [Clostridium swellfunianum]MCM0648112.1 GH3 auxin-responsive promoter family protein [Clostridium swellfunianum]
MSYSFVKVSKFSEKKFNKDTENAFSRNTEVLNKTLSRNCSTEFGKKYNFSNIHSVEDYKKKVPLCTYKDYEQYISRMCSGEENILVAEEVKFYGMSSGTTGKQKYIPVTKSSLSAVSEVMSMLIQRILYNNFKSSWSYGKGLSLTDMVIAGYTQGGKPICAGTSGGMRSIKWMIPFIWTTPVEVMNLGKGIDTLYLHLLFAIKERNLMYINGIFISSVLDMFRHLEKHSEELVRDIRKGTISRNIGLSEADRKVLLKKISPDAGRADFLEKEFKKGFKGIAKRIWPKLIYIASVTGANFSIYDDKVAEYSGNIPVYSSVYSATEAAVGVNRYINKQRYVVIPRVAFFEFIPVEDLDKEQPSTKNLNELRLGSEYEVVATNQAGLYRYRIGDVIKVVDFYNQSPEIEFLYRKNQLLNMVSEKTTEEHVLNALSNIFKNLGASFSDYTVTPDNSISPGRYVFYIEAKDSLKNSNIKSISSLMDKELSKINIAYGRQRSKRKLAEAQVKLVKEGTFMLIKKMKIAKGVSKNQFKMPRVVTDREIIDLLDRNIKY